MNQDAYGAFADPRLSAAGLAADLTAAAGRLNALLDQAALAGLTVNLHVSAPAWVAHVGGEPHPAQRLGLSVAEAA